MVADNVVEICNEAEEKYFDYLTRHIQNCKLAYACFVGVGLNEQLGLSNDDLISICKDFDHDSDKWDVDKFKSYALHFFGTEEEKNDPQNKAEFKRCSAEHQEMSDHHYENYINWAYHYEDGKLVRKDIKLIKEMPNRYIFEMLIDWMSFGYYRNDLLDIFDYWDNKKKDLSTKLGPKTFMKVTNAMNFLWDNKDKILGTEKVARRVCKRPDKNGEEFK